MTLSLILSALQFPALATWGQQAAMFLNAFSENNHFRMVRHKTLHLQCLTSLQRCPPVNNSACMLSYTYLIHCTNNQATESTIINLQLFS